MGVAGEFIPMIAHGIREQVCLAVIPLLILLAIKVGVSNNLILSYEEAEQAYDVRPRPFRSKVSEEDFEPEVRLLDDDDIDKLFKERDRSTR